LNSFINEERNILYNFFSDLDLNSFLNLENAELCEFFSTKVAIENNYQSLSLDGFKCFKTIFCFINQNASNL